MFRRLRVSQAGFGAAAVALSALGGGGLAGEGEPMRAGIIGCDTSHAPAFTAILNDAQGRDHVPGLRVVAAFPGGSRDLPASADRVGKFTEELRERWKVEIVESIPALCAKVDAVLLLTVDGRPHLDQARPVISAKKPLFIDKPMAASVSDAREIFRLAAASGVPVFSSSALRFASRIQRARRDPDLGPVLGCEAFGPSPTESHHPDLFWYGIHGVEILFTVMGPGCESVVRTHTEGADLVVGRWKDGRIGSFRGIRKGAEPYGALVFAEKKVVQVEPQSGENIYRPLLEEIVKFFRTGKPPIDPQETLEILTFMEAADLSKKEGGRPVGLKELLAR